MRKATLILLFFCSLVHADITGRVVAVIDGDTIKVLDAHNTEYKVRLSGIDASYAQVLAGMAWWYRYYAEEQLPEDRGRYESAEDEAKARGWGLWADPNPVNPYKWRQIPTYEHPNEES